MGFELLCTTSFSEVSFAWVHLFPSCFIPQLHRHKQITEIVELRKHQQLESNPRCLSHRESPNLARVERSLAKYTETILVTGKRPKSKLRSAPKQRKRYILKFSEFQLRRNFFNLFSASGKKYLSSLFATISEQQQFIFFKRQPHLDSSAIL